MKLLVARRSSLVTPRCARKKLETRAISEVPRATSNERRATKKAVFLDRDGTINVDKEYIGHPDDVELLPGAVEGLKLLAEKKFLLIVVSNQSGVGRGYFSQHDVEKVNHRIEQELAAHKVKIDRFYYCPHRPEEKCCCRKPSAELVLAAAKFFNIDLPRSFFVGDKALDVQTGLAAGCKTVLIDSEQYELDPAAKPDFICKNLFEAARWIIK